MKIGLIGPGIISIPPKGWGAVEILIWDYYIELKSKHDVYIINEIRNYPEDQIAGTEYSINLINKINSYNFDFVHIHYDVLYYIIPFLNSKKIGFTSHYPYIDQIDKHNGDGFNKIFNFMCSNNNIINFVLAEKDYNFLKSHNCKNIVKLENGISESINITLSPFNATRTIYLGKIENRKNQYKYQIIDCIDFVGPLNCLNFNDKINYLGSWTREDVTNKLTEYGNLLLLSKGEADPLVVKEALMAGLGVIINRTSAKNLKEQDFITIIEDEKMNDINFIREKIEENRLISLNKREEIREYAINNFSWKKLINNYVEKIKNNITLVSTLIDIGRDKKGDGRKLEEYLEWFKETLQINCDMYIFIEKKFYDFVIANRPKNYNTRIVLTTIEDSYYYKYIDIMRNILNNDIYKSRIAYPERVECVLPEYNIIQYSKFGWLNYAIDENKFNSDYFFWIDAGISRFFYGVNVSKPFGNDELLKNAGNRFIIQKRHDLETYNIDDKFIWGAANLVKGTMFGGRAEIIKDISNKVEEVFKHYMIEKDNLNNEQLAIGLVWKNNKELFYLIEDNNEKHLIMFEKFYV